MNTNQMKEIAKVLNEKLTDEQKAELERYQKWQTEGVDIKGNKRLEGESFEDYKERRNTENRLLKIYLKGRFTPSSQVV